MKIDMEKAMHSVGSKHLYQRLLFLCLFMMLIGINYFRVMIPLIRAYPKATCIDSKNKFVECESIDSGTSVKQFCNYWNKVGLTVSFNENETKTFIGTHKIYCDDFKIDIALLMNIVGSLIGAFITASYGDSIGRKYVLLASITFFIFFFCIFSFIENYLLCVLSILFMGITSVGGTIVSFIYIIEVVKTESRNAYICFLFSSLPISGFLYYVIYDYSVNWKWNSVVVLSILIISDIWLVLSFVETPRYLLIAKRERDCLLALLRIANKNDRLAEYRNYLLKNLFKDIEFENLPSGEGKFELNTIYGEISSLIANCNFSIFEGYSMADDLSSNDENSFRVCKEEKLIEDGVLKIQSNKRAVGIFTLLKFDSFHYGFFKLAFMWTLVSYCIFSNFLTQRSSTSNIVNEGYIVHGSTLSAILLSAILMELNLLGRLKMIGYSAFISSIFSLLLLYLKDFEIINSVLYFIYRSSLSSLEFALILNTVESIPTCIRTLGTGVTVTVSQTAYAIAFFTAKEFEVCYFQAAAGILVFIIQFYMEETLNEELRDEIQVPRKSKRISSKLN